MPPSLARFETEMHPPRRLLIRYRPSQTQIGEIISAIAAAGLTIADLSTEETSLEDIFLDLTRAAREACAEDGLSASGRAATGHG